jgi:hypothetical protein
VGIPDFHLTKRYEEYDNKYKVKVGSTLKD